MRRSLIPDRWEQIISLVEQQGAARIEQMASILGISEATVRRDLARIHERGLIERTRGGAAPSKRTQTPPTMMESRRINPLQKELIGRAAAELVRNGDSVMLDGGYTTLQVAENITATDLRVITNSLDAAHILAGHPDIILAVIGGELDRTCGTMLGPLMLDQIRLFAADKAILGADALSVESGLTSPLYATAETKKAMIAGAHETIVVADHSKLGRLNAFRVAPIESITTLVTDDQADPALLDAFRAAGLEVVVASASSEN